MKMKVFSVNLAISVLLLPVASGASQTANHEALGKRLVGKSHAEVRKILERENPRYAFKAWQTHRGSTGLARHQLDPDTYLHLSYANIKGNSGSIADQDPVTSYEIASISELAREVPEGTFESIRIIHHSPTPQPQGFDPVALIKAVNHFRGLGPEETVRRLRTYHNLATSEDRRPRWRYDLDEQRIFFIVRLLFVRKDGNPKMPWMSIGATNPWIPDGSQDWPLFPLVVRGDVPLFMAYGYMLAGWPESPLSHIEYCQKNCVVRRTPITPSISPIEAVERVYASEEWQTLFNTQKIHPEEYPADCRHKYLLRCQAMRCFPTDLGLPVELPRQFNPYCSGPENADRAWDEYLKELERVNLKWDPKTQEFRVEESASKKSDAGDGK